MSLVHPVSKEQITAMREQLKRVKCPNCGEIKDLEAFQLNPVWYSPFSDIQWLCNHCKIIFRHSGCTLRDPYHRPMGFWYINQGQCPYYKLIQPKVFPKQRIRIEGDQPPYKLVLENVEEKTLTPEEERLLQEDWEKDKAQMKANPPTCSECGEEMTFFEQEEADGVRYPMFRCKCGHIEDPGLKVS